MFWARIDNRLIHGQVIETWLPHTGAENIIVVNNELAEDSLQQEIMSLAIPSSVTSSFVPVAKLAAFINQLDKKITDMSLILFATCQDAKKAFDSGFEFGKLNVGNIHYGPGKNQISPNIALSKEDETCLRYFSERGVELDFRCVPNDTLQVRL